ncbi:MAG TPA: hypothetical protein VET85_09215 [Stellaceae bacterium]|nr:hypothetical protein [Stellaceae bacterium]
MFGLITRVVLLLAGVITGWFVTQDAASFGTIEMSIAILLITFFVAAAAFGPSFIARFRRRNGRGSISNSR